MTYRMCSANRVAIAALLIAAILCVGAAAVTAVGSGPMFASGKTPRVRATVDVEIAALGLKDSVAKADLFDVPAGTVGDFDLNVGAASSEVPIGSGSIKLFPGCTNSLAYCVTVDGIPLRCRVGTFVDWANLRAGTIKQAGPIVGPAKIGVAVVKCVLSSAATEPVKLTAELTGILYRK